MSGTGFDAGLMLHGGDSVSGAGTPQAVARLRTFHTLDALRGIAALAIVLVHASFFLGVKPPAHGYMAVDLFFVMSGFIIAYRYDADLARGLTLGRFVTIRLIRLYPLFLLGASLGVLPALAAVAHDGGDAFHKGLVASFPLSVFMLPSPFVRPRIEELYPLNYVAWSLALEIVVNILYAATFRFWTPRRLIGLLCIAFVALVACANIYGSLKYGFAWPAAPVGWVRILFGFAAGVLIYRIYAAKPFESPLPWWIMPLATIALLGWAPAGWGGAWEVVAVAFIVPSIVVGAVASTPPARWQGLCASAGVLSYVVYSLHAPFVGLFLRGKSLLHLDPHVVTPAQSVAFALLLAALCGLAHVAYDRPIRRALTRRAGAPVGTRVSRGRSTAAKA